MERKAFLKLIGLGAVASAVAPEILLSAPKDDFTKNIITIKPVRTPLDTITEALAWQNRQMLAITGIPEFIMVGHKTYNDLQKSFVGGAKETSFNGCKSISYNGIPVIVNPVIPDNMIIYPKNQKDDEFSSNFVMCRI